VKNKPSVGPNDSVALMDELHGRQLHGITYWTVSDFSLISKAQLTGNEFATIGTPL
jgi:hypothetical protein